TEPVITVIHAELNDEDIRILRLNIVRHTFQRQPGGIAINGGIGEQNAGPGAVGKFIELRSNPGDPAPVNGNTLPETDGITKEEYTNHIVFHEPQTCLV